MTLLTAPAAAVAQHAARESVPFAVAITDIATMKRMGVQPLGASLAREGPIGRIGRHPGRRAAAIVAGAGPVQEKWRRSDEDTTDVRTFL